MYRDGSFGCRDPGARRGQVLPGHNPFAFGYRYQLIGSHRLELLQRPIRPVNIDVRGFRCAEAKMKAKIVRGIIARLAHHRLRLHLPTVMHQHPRADCAAIRRGPEVSV